MSLERIATFLFFFSRVVVPPTKMYCKKYASNPKTAFKIRTNIIVHDYAPTSLNTPPRARRDVAKERATRPSLFWGSPSSICRDVFLSPVVFSPSRHSKDDVFSRRSVFFPSRRSRKNGGKECRRQKTERRRRRVHLRVFFRRFVGVADCFCVLHVRSIRVRKGGYGTGGEKGQGESESGAQDAVCSVAFGRDYCRWK